MSVWEVEQHESGRGWRTVTVDADDFSLARSGAAVFTDHDGVILRTWARGAWRAAAKIKEEGTR